MQHGTPQRVSKTNARHPGRRSLRIRLQPLFRVARHVFQTISQYLAATSTLFFSTISSAPNARDLVPAHISERTRIPSGCRGSRRGRMVS